MKLAAILRPNRLDLHHCPGDLYGGVTAAVVALPLALAFTVVTLTGRFQILFDWLKLGRYVNLMPYPVISGFLTGVGCILIILLLG